MNLTVLGDRAFVRPDQQPDRSDSGLHLVYDRQHSTMRGTVVAVGAGPVTGKGIRLPHVVSVGDRVIFPPDAGEEMLFEKETIIAMREDEILAVVQE